MKKYYKLFIILLIIAFVIPQVVFASWWNPFSWGIWGRIAQVFHKTDIQKQTTASLENRIKELEEKLKEQPPATPQEEKANGTTNQDIIKKQQEAKKAAAVEIKTAQAVEQARLQAEKQKVEQEKLLTQQAEQQKQQELAKQQESNRQQELARQQEQIRQQELAKQQETLRKQNEEIARLTRLSEEKRQLESLIASKYNEFVSQLNTIQSQLNLIKTEIDDIKADYASRISEEENRLASMEIIYGRVASLTQERNSKLQPLYDQYNALATKYNMLIGAPIPVSYPSSSSGIPQYLTFYPNSSGGGDIYGNGGQFHLTVQKQGSVFIISGF